MKLLPTKIHVLGLGVLMLVAAVVWLAWTSDVLAQPPIPHSLEGRENCLMCHETGLGGAPQVPSDHAGRTNETCEACHATAPEGSSDAPYIPHTLEGREDCVACHVVAAESAEPGALPTDTPEPIPTPLVYPEPVGEANTCLDCHQALGGRSELVVNDWQTSIHAERGVVCADCHGGDPSKDTIAESMSQEAGYIGKPDPADIPDLCGSCHADVSLMRQYDLPTDQLAKYRESYHGQQLAAGDTKVATCASCHSSHAIYKANDPRASVYHLNVPELCAECHADTEYMAGYDIPTDQFELYQGSVHGIALLDNQNTRAPSCATCHGTHGAAPPGFAEVANVCGSCHDATQNYYLSSPHNSENSETPQCITCHGRYDVHQPSEAMFLGNDPRHCGSCHDPESDVGSIVQALYQSLVDADAALHKAETSIEDAMELGMIVSEEEGLLVEARTKLITARASQHSVDLEQVKAESDASIALSEQAQQQAEEAIDESRFRRQAMVIAVVVIGFVVLSLVLLRRELLAREAEDEATDETGSE